MKKTRFEISMLMRKDIMLALVSFAALALGAPPSICAQQALNQGEVQKEYSDMLEARGGQAPLKWRVIQGDLPDGITLDRDTGRLSGKPVRARAVPYRFTVEVEDSSNPPQKFEQDFEILVKSATLRGIIAASSPAGGESRETEVGNALPAEISNSDEVTVSVSNKFDETLLQRVIDTRKGEIRKGRAAELIKETVGSYKSLDKVYSCIVHIINWLPRANNKYEAANERWHLFKHEGGEWKEEEDFDGTRIYGSRKVAVLLIHLGARQTWDITYKIKATKKRPAPLQNALDLIATISGRSKTVSEDNTFVWGGDVLFVSGLPADIAVTGTTYFINDEDRPIQQPKEFSKTYDNEGRYYWDVTVGLPVKSVDEFKYESINGIVTPRNVSQQNAYAFLNLFPRAFDVKSDETYPFPHLVLGLPISGKPLDRPFVGAGYGINNFLFKFNLFAGYTFDRVEEPGTLGAGTAATQSQLESDLRTRRIPKFIFGVNIPVRLIKDALTKKD
jgi:hypothetical protein